MANFETVTDALTKEHYIYEFVKDRDAKALGKYYQDYLLGILADGQSIDLTLIVVGDNTVVTGAVTETDREQRYQACLATCRRSVGNAARRLTDFFQS